MTPLRLHLIALAALATLAASSPLAAAEYTWDGNGPNDLWSFSAGANGNTNWVEKASPTGSLLRGGDRLFFGGSQRLANTNDYTGLSVSGIAFNPGAGAFVLGGQALTLTGDLLNLSATLQRLSFASLAVGSDQTWRGGKGGLQVDNFQIGDRALTLNGPVMAQATGVLNVGTAGVGSLSGSTGTQLQTAGAWLGNQTGSRGTVTLNGGAQWQSNGQVYVGLHGEGNLTLRGGAVLTSDGGHVGRFAGGQGQALISGAGSAWVSDGLPLQIGYQGQGAVRVDAGGRLTANDLYVGVLAGGSGTLEAQGGTLSGDTLRIADTAASGRVIVGSGGTLKFEQVMMAGDALASSLFLDGTGTTAQVAALVMDGNSTLSLSGGARWTGASMALGTSLQGSVTLARLTQATVTLSGNLALGSNGTDAAITRLIASDSTLSADQLSIRRSGSLFMESGTLDVSTLYVHPQGQFSWLGGTVRLDSLFLVRDGGMGSQLSVCGSCTLMSRNWVRIEASGMLQLEAGAVLVTPQLELRGGRIQGSLLDLDRIAKIRGGGTISARVHGNGRVQAGDAMVLGDATAIDGISLDGTLNVSAPVTLLDANLALLNGLVTVDSGGWLSSVNGIWLGTTGRLTTQGGSGVVAGRFVNDGSVSVVATGHANLRFIDMVAGSGSFEGRMRFDAGYDPGGWSLARVTFQDASVTFGEASQLLLDVAADGRSDQLSLRGLMGLSGDIVLRFQRGFQADAGMTLQLIQGGVLSGQPHFQVEGFDPSRVDFSHFLQDGSVTISAVPEASPSAMLLGGLAMLGAWLRRRQASSKSASAT